MLEGHLPASTYRLQLSHQFTFRDATGVLSYLSALGITDSYTSPLLKSRPGSSHGYDICDHRELDPELGTRAEFDAFVERLASFGMGLIVDIVPNHMGLDSNTNPWWFDVLEHGPSSPYAAFFDIDWDPVTAELRNRLLLPLLQDAYGDVLHRGEIALACDGGRLCVRYADRRLPVEPRSSVAVLRGCGDTLARLQETDGADAREYADLIAMLERLPPFTACDPADRAARRGSRDINNRIAALAARSQPIQNLIDASIDAFNGVPDRPESFDRLHALLDEQPYRLAHWRTAFDNINYRRFFDINDLGGLRVEDPSVFEASHALIVDLMRAGCITGLRVDHPDGLFDPAQYFVRLSQATATTGDGLSRAAPYILAEKILAPDEVLPDDWPVAGTTGYGFLAVVNGLFVNAANERAVTSTYQRLTNHREPFGVVAYEAKRHVLASSMASELSILTRALKRIAAANRTTRDFTLNVLRHALIEVLACFPVYRTYVNEHGYSGPDLQSIDFATDHARRRNRIVPPSAFMFLRNVLLTNGSATEDRGAVAARRAFAMKFQQLSAPVQAKAVEDTSFYRYNALISLNEVGSDPARFARSVEEFHEGNRVRLERWPLELLASSTHDTKRGEDARARLNVVSEIPQRWRRAVGAWMRMNRRHRTMVDREPAPDRRDEYLFYQSLVGAWPAEAEGDPIPREAAADVVERMQQFMQKAVKEAKRHSSWINPNPAYEVATSRFVQTVLAGSGAQSFLEAFVPMARWVAMRGVVNSLAQLVLKLASPGVSDFYQGAELWNLSLADPDNRRAVDFSYRQRLLDELMPWIACAESADGDRASIAELERTIACWLMRWPDARIKMFITACGTRWRARERELALRGSYRPLSADADARAHIVSFAREQGTNVLIAVVPRLMSGAPPWPIGEAVWHAGRLALPAELAHRTFSNVFTGAVVTPTVAGTEAWLPLSDVLRVCPVAMLHSPR
jgi:(1->4)-alpha-D-glucan 1-alpha-D-glucosylmutase